MCNVCLMILTASKSCGCGKETSGIRSHSCKSGYAVLEEVILWKLQISKSEESSPKDGCVQLFRLRWTICLRYMTIKIVQGDERLFVAMPSRKDENGVFRDIVHPISAAARKKLEAEIMETYQQHLALMEAETEAAQHAQHV